MAAHSVISQIDIIVSCDYPWASAVDTCIVAGMGFWERCCYIRTMAHSFLHFGSTTMSRTRAIDLKNIAIL